MHGYKAVMHILKAVREEDIADKLLWDQKFIQAGVIRLVELESEIEGKILVVKPSEVVARVLLGLGASSGKLAKYCVQKAPTHRWDEVMLDSEKKELVKQIANGHRKHLWEMGRYR